MINIEKETFSACQMVPGVIVFNHFATRIIEARNINKNELQSRWLRKIFHKKSK